MNSTWEYKQSCKCKAPVTLSVVQSSMDNTDSSPVTIEFLCAKCGKRFTYVATRGKE